MLPISPCEDTLGHHLMSGTSETGPTVVGVISKMLYLSQFFFSFSPPSESVSMLSETIWHKFIIKF